MWALVLAFCLGCRQTVTQEITDVALNAAAYTYPFKGSCGEVNTSTLYTVYGDVRECTADCPSDLLTYPIKQEMWVNSQSIIDGTYTFLDDGCNFPEMNGDIWSDATTSQCYHYNNQRNLSSRETHSMWIKPKLQGHNGVIVSPTRDVSKVFGITSDHHLALVETYYGSGNIKEMHVYENTYIPDGEWTHLAFQVDHEGDGNGEVSVFVDGIFSPPVLPGRTDSSVAEPVQITQCLNIGYSPSGILVCGKKDFPSYEGEFNPEYEFEYLFPYPEWINCSSSAYLETQQGLQARVFSENAAESIYKNCQSDRNILTLFACVSYIPPLKVQTSDFFTPCRSLCQDVVANCPDLKMPGLNLNCSQYPVDECINSTYLSTNFGVYRGQIRDYEIYDDILTNREIEHLYEPDMVGLSKVQGLSHCLCPPEHPALSRVYGDSTCVKNYDINETEINMRNYSIPRLYSPNQWYHPPDYAVDGNINTAWVSLPGLQDVSLEIIFDEPVQAMAVDISFAPALPDEGIDGNHPLEIFLMSSGVNKRVAVVTNNCSGYTIKHRPFSLGCATPMSDGSGPNQTVYVDLLQGREQWYNDSYMDVQLLSFLRAEGLRLKFSGLRPIPVMFEGGPPEMLSAHLVSEVSIPAIRFPSPVLCDCYPNGTDTEGSCNDLTGQCPCLPSHGNQADAGLRCEPYATSMIPDFGPESGVTWTDISGGYFGDDKVAVQGILGSVVVSLTVRQMSQTLITVITPPIDASTHPELLTNPLRIIITLGNGHVIDSGIQFQYKNDPNITTITPRDSFIKGGIPQTVIGQDLDSVYRPLMRVVMILNDIEYLGLPELTLCTVVNNTVMTCPTPSFEAAPVFSRKKRDIMDDGVESKAAVKGPDRFRRQSVNRQGSINIDGVKQFYITFFLDGVPTYQNVMSLGEEGIIYVYTDPDIQSFDPEEFIYRPYKEIKPLEITGQRMNYGCKLKDYVVTIGDGICENQELLTNQMQCLPPSEPPTLGEFPKDGAHRVLCRVGNITVHMGYMEYRTSLLDEEWFIAVIVVVSLVVGVLLIFLIVYCCLWKYYGESPYQRLKKHKKNQKMNNYVLGPEGGTSAQENDPLQPQRQRNLMLVLNQTEPELHEKVRKCQIDPQRMDLGKRIGRGNFGMVHDGIYNSPDGQIKVAIKTLRGDTESMKEVSEFLEEATIMQDFRHPNVLTLYGVVIKQNTPYVLLPMMDKGDLKKHVSNPQNHFSVGELLGYGCQIADGMAYLAGLKFVHRDLAARNCMINSDKLVKIADFGLARDIYEKDYYAVEDRKRPLPVKWMAVECLDTFKFSSKSDVWSYGVTLWELLNRGLKPYSDVDNVDMKRYLLMGRRLEKPSYCPDKVYELLQACWLPDPSQRPKFSEIKDTLDRFLRAASEFENNPIYEGKTQQSDEHVNDYLEMMGMAPGITTIDDPAATHDDTYQGYLQLVTEVPSEMPSSALLNNNTATDIPLASGAGLTAKLPSDRYSRDPTAHEYDIAKPGLDRMRSNDSYVDPVSSAYSSLKDGQHADGTSEQYTELKKMKPDSPPTSPGYLEPVSFSKKGGKEGVTIGNKKKSVHA